MIFSRLLLIPRLINDFSTPISMWLPFGIKSNTTYFLIIIYLVIAPSFMFLVATNSGWLLIGSLNALNLQFDFLSDRWQKLPRDIENLYRLKKSDYFIKQFERKVIKRNVQHHLYIFR